ncbi:DUF3592 domain-containing protein [Corynebacterium sp.]|uniref:DUF3592 domain-containing protein n=1 Tax=Corynebacterium sp. TaxID=1720 RepID=UPI0034A1CD90
MGGGWPRRFRQAILVLLAVLLVSCLGMVFGAWWGDRGIESDTGHAVAEVRSVERMRTSVDFVDEDGEYRSPPRGVRYPVGLEEGDRVRVEYDRGDPDLARVEGRRWTLTLVPAASVFAAGLLIAAVPWWLTVRATRLDTVGSPYDKGK